MLTKKDKKKRYNKRTTPSNNHLFDGTAVQNFKDSFTKGDKLGGTIGALGSNVAGIIGESIKEPELQGTEAITDAIETQQNFQSTANTNDDLLAEMAGFVNVRTNYNTNEFKRGAGEVAGEFIGDSISSFASGASSGSWITGLANTGLSLIKNGIKRGRENAAARQFAQDASDDARKANLVKAQTLTAKAGALDQAADQRALAAYAAYGGGINTPKFSDFPSEVTEFNTGGSHEENPYDGIPQGIAPDGLPNLVEEGEVKFDNYIFSDRLMLNKNDKKKYKFLKGKTYADAAKAIKKELGVDERPNDLIAKTDLEEHLNILSTLQEEERAKRGLRGENRMMYKNGGHIFRGDRQEIRDYMDAGFSRREARNLASGNFNLDAPSFDWSSLGQAAPAIGSTVGLIGNLFDKPKYEHTKPLTKTEKSISPITFTPNLQRVQYKPTDISPLLNKVMAQSAANRAAITQQNATNPHTVTIGLLANDYNTNNQLGDIFLKTAAQDDEKKMKAITTNNQVALAEAEGIMKAASTNATLQDRALTRQTEKDIYAARLNMAEDQAWDAANSANMTGLFDNLGAMGKEKKDMALATMKSLIEKGNLEEARKIAEQFGLVFKYGGKLKKKKGYTI